MLIKINGEEIDVAEGSSIQDVIEETNAPYTPGSIVCLIKGKKELEKNISKYKIKTTQGSIILQLDESDEAKPLVDVWKNQYEEFVDLDIRWSTPTEVAIGPVVTDLEPTHDEFKYFEGDVVLSLSSFSNESTHLIMLKENTTNVYGVPPFNKGIFARVIGGKKTLDNLTDDDKVTGIEPIIERSTTTDSASVSDLSIVLEEGNELYTYISFEIDENSPVCVEHLFSIVKDGRIKVSFDSESFLGFYELEGHEKPKEDTTKRNRGTMTIRNNGKGVGKLFIYRENRVLTPNHTTVGNIVQGMELIDIAKENDFITVKSEQQRL
ncbi:MAG: methanogenesis marker 3 protein, partial [Methanosphaera sp.]|nr:methanogenesis marker 3 protein [Methanosphaera sp.]